MDDIIVIRGAGDLASGIAHRLYKSGFRLLLTEIEKPLVVRRCVSFANAIPMGEAEVEGVRAIRALSSESIAGIWNTNSIPILCDNECSIVDIIKPLAVVDAIMAKKNLGTGRGMAPITVGVGPGFEAGEDVDAVVETKRGHDLGRVIYKGWAEADTGIPGNIMGYSQERLLRASKSGRIRNVLKIGDTVKQGDVIAFIEDEPVKGSITGVLRGLIADNTYVKEGVKIGDIDPRGIREYCYTISDKSRSVAGGVLEAILHFRNERFGR